MNIPWDKIFEWVMLLIAKCSEKNAKSIAGNLRRPGRVGRWVFERGLRRRDVSLTKEQLAEVYQTAADASDEELLALVHASWGMF